MKANCSLILLLLFASCGPGIFDVAKDLPNGFVYRQDGSSNYLYVNRNDGVQFMYPQITKLAFDEQFILIQQHPNLKYIKNDILAKTLSKPSINSNNVDSVVKNTNVDSLLSQDKELCELIRNEVNYWIIRIRDKQFFGPYSRREYVLKRSQLNVSLDLFLFNKDEAL